jgi:hypothetical protein
MNVCGSEVRRDLARRRKGPLVAERTVSVGWIAPNVHSQRTPIRGRICEFVAKYHFNIGCAID